MKWRRKQQEKKKEGKKEEAEEEVKKQTSYWASSSSSSSSSSFSLSSVLPFSWFAKLTASKPPKPKRSGVAGGGGGRRRIAEVFTPPPSPSRHPRSASAHLPFASAVLDRFPPPVHDAAAPHRLSLGDDEGADLRQRVAPTSARHHRSARHHSVGDLDLTLGHIIPFSRRAATARLAESDSGSDASGCDLGIGRRPPRRRRRQRQRRSARASTGLSPEQRMGSDGRDGLPRRSISGKIRHRAKVKVRSPRPTAAEIERLRAAARRGRGEEEEGGSGKRKKGLERFAVVKCSCDPQRDFRESMEEMIWQKGIGRPEELESLLACYLSLNADEHHDVIVKVFRQVWFELNPERLAPECNLRR